ncbi:MAG: bifunctional UDP-4-amino-4-deoxy-L-arabinose formyltransferase/UDP-glucuronic acid oxidase ArnA [Candidatus Omnitrophota bacterium]
MKSVVFAYNQIGCEGIKTLLDNGIEVAAVFTHKDNPQENIWFDSVAVLAAEKGIPVFAPDDINNLIWIEKIKKINPDIIFSFYYRDILGKDILNIPAAGCLNLHGSLLPKYRGRCPINWAIINGEKNSGVTLHYMIDNPDAGDILGQKMFEITADDTALLVHRKAADAAVVLLNEVLPLIKNKTIKPIAQDASKATYFSGRGSADGEINWTQSAAQVRNLVRAVTAPYPGAFSYIAKRKCFFWEVRVIKAKGTPGEILSINPLQIACGQGAVQINSAQAEGSIFLNGIQFAAELGLMPNMKFGSNIYSRSGGSKKKHILILGINGFIGNHLSERLLASNNYEVHGIDLASNSVERFLKHPNFHFFEGDISINRHWIEYHVRKCDIVLPLVAIATPAEYTRNPLRVFELDFEENLRIVRYCAKYGKRVIFPSTSEVYGMCDDPEFDEDNSKLILGPIHKQRWIYSCSKQLLDRVIWAYGSSKGLRFSLFRPFNWIGPRLDSLAAARIGSSRVITQFILNLVEGTPILLVDGGKQKRCFTNVKDGIECLFRIIEDKKSNCNSKIINIGHPDNDVTIRELAEMLAEKFEAHALRKNFPPFAGIREIESKSYYGKGYEDVSFRKPSIKNAKRLLEWQPHISLEQSISETLDFFLKEEVSQMGIKNP